MTYFCYMLLIYMIKVFFDEMICFKGWNEEQKGSEKA